MSDANRREPDPSTLLELTTRIVSAYAGNATLSATELTEVIGTVSRALIEIGTAPAIPAVQELVPAVPVKKSVSPDFIVCLEDGKKLKMLKRHLRGVYGMTPQEYRTKWNLPRDYPMVAPNYAVTRSQLAKKIGLGRSPATVVVSTPIEPSAASKKAPARRRNPAKNIGADKSEQAQVVESRPEAAAAPAKKPTARRGRPAKAA